uniref:Core shell protein Gag P30 domain-containing protein n=1 Tax=Monodelphis domestica TaxID=13616 RepID=K7DYZ2_MONDO
MMRDKINKMRDKIKQNEDKIKQNEDKIKQNEDKIKQNEDKIENIEDKIENVEDKIEKNEDKIENIEDKIENIEDKIEKIEDTIEKIEDTIEKIEDKIGNIENKIEKLEDKIGNIENKIGNIEDKMGDMEDKIGKIEEKMQAQLEDLKCFLQDQWANTHSTRNRPVSEPLNEEISFPEIEMENTFPITQLTDCFSRVVQILSEFNPQSPSPAIPASHVLSPTENQIPIQGRSCPPRETCPCQTDPQVQNSTRGLFPLREVPEIGRNGDVVTLRHRIPFTPQEINEFTRNIPTYEQDPFLVTKKMGDIFFQYNPSYKDVESLLQAFLSEHEKNKIIAHVNKTRGRNAAHWPSQDPEWDYNNPEDYLQLYRCREAILTAMKECADSTDKWMELEKIKQKENETPSRFMDRIIEFGDRYLDWDLNKENSLRQVRRMFVNNSCKVIKNYFKTQCPRWSDMDLEELRKTAIYVFKGNEEKEKENNDDMEEMKKKMRCVIDRITKLESGHDNEPTTIAPLQKSNYQSITCHFCEKKGHKMMECRTFLKMFGRNTQFNNGFRNNNYRNYDNGYRNQNSRNYNNDYGNNYNEYRNKSFRNQNYRNRNWEFNDNAQIEENFNDNTQQYMRNGACPKITRGTNDPQRGALQGGAQGISQTQ